MFVFVKKQAPCAVVSVRPGMDHGSHKALRSSQQQRYHRRNTRTAAPGKPVYNLKSRKDEKKIKGRATVTVEGDLRKDEHKDVVYCAWRCLSRHMARRVA